ncbi:MAG: hypothetical protein GYA24_12315 [Candidatus Lokiarchaeota archaeon]|nr:hypothetical protein [Candidatus Lokiarchaeota archaeon]
MIGTNKAPGTTRVRKFLGVMVKAGQLRVFTHFDLIHKGVHHDEFVKAALGDLMIWGNGKGNSRVINDPGPLNVLACRP